METSPPLKNLTYSDMRSNIRSYRGTRSTTAPPTFLLIPSTPSTASSTTAAPTGIENIRVYSAIAVSVYINIVYK